MHAEEATVTDLLDVSAIAKPGVYVLSLRGRVVFVGRAKSMLARIYAHKVQQRGKPTPDWSPAKPINFDAIAIHPCLIDLLDEVYNQTCIDLGWSELPRSLVGRRA